VPSFTYCPQCAAPLESDLIGGKLRPTCPACGFVYFADPKVGVGVLLVENGRLLLTRRAMNPEKGKWSLPAGFVDRGEDPRETAVRETREETGLEVTIAGLVDVYYNPPGQGGASIFILYRATCIGGHLQAGDDADDARFFPLNALPELAFASTQDAVRRLLA
jgi:8-oxo-dGTP diphosphatase